MPVLRICIDTGLGAVIEHRMLAIQVLWHASYDCLWRQMTELAEVIPLDLLSLAYDAIDDRLWNALMVRD